MSKYNCCIKTEKDLEESADNNIEPYGFKNCDIKEWISEEETHRTRLRRQRDKILYTGGFRRLQDKTQVMSATLTGDHRTRLTHTLEVEQIAVSVADALGLNKDLVSAIALGHDVGHTPFGHAAERKLNELLKDAGGFHHPIQSVKYLWEKYGHKLINEVYEGILLHDSDVYTLTEENVKKEFQYSCNKGKDCLYLSCYVGKVPTTFEAQVVIWADKIAYITHDLEDFLQSSISDDIRKRNGGKEICEICSELESLSGEKQIKTIEELQSRNLIRGIIDNLINNSAENINELGSSSAPDAHEKTKKNYLDKLTINFNLEYRKKYYRLREFLDYNYIFSPKVQRSDAKSQNIVEFLYKQFNHNYKLTPLSIRSHIDEELIRYINEMEEHQNEKYTKIEDAEKHVRDIDRYQKKRKEIIGRIIASYISTMSDTYAEHMYCNLNGSNDTYSL